MNEMIVSAVIGISAAVAVLLAVGAVTSWAARRAVTKRILERFGEPPMKIRCYVCRQDLWVQPSDPYPGINDHLASRGHKSNAKERA